MVEAKLAMRHVEDMLLCTCLNAAVARWQVKRKSRTKSSVSRACGGSFVDEAPIGVRAGDAFDNPQSPHPCLRLALPGNDCS